MVHAPYQSYHCRHRYNNMIILCYINYVPLNLIFAAPSAPPTSFHIVVLNSTAIEFQWELPPTEFQNGIIRGYRLFIREQSSNTEKTTDVP